VVAAGQASVVITHSKAQPRQHFPRPHYDDLLSEIKNFLRERVQHAVDAGVPENKIILDPGHDLNKNTFHSLELTRRLTEIADIGLPLLAAVSNKDFVGEATGLSKADRLAPTIAAATACMLSGARILRMHDVAHAVAAAHMVEAILGFRRPASPRHNL
jgi:dihydropteroate synthase